MQYIEAPSSTKAVYRNALFLAGGISNCPDWQGKVVEGLKDLPITIYNPRRYNFDITNQRETEIQIYWEFHRLRQSDQILFWFPCETICPITLFEYGAALERQSKLFVGSHKDYERILDLNVQTRLRNPRMTIRNDLEDVIMEARIYYGHIV